MSELMVGPDPFVKMGRDGDPRALWVNVTEVAAVGPLKDHNSIVVLKSGERLVVQGKDPGEIVFEISDAWRPDAASDSEG
jgi:hypothetical protein